MELQEYTQKQLRIQLQTRIDVCEMFDSHLEGMRHEGKLFSYTDYYRALDEIVQLREELDARELA